MMWLQQGCSGPPPLGRDLQAAAPPNPYGNNTTNSSLQYIASTNTSISHTVRSPDCMQNHGAETPLNTKQFMMTRWRNILITGQIRASQITVLSLEYNS